MTSNARRRLTQLETKTTAPTVKRIKIVRYGLPADGLYHGEAGEVFTAAGFAALETEYQVILIEYGDWPRDQVAT